MGNAPAKKGDTTENGMFSRLSLFFPFVSLQVCLCCMKVFDLIFCVWFLSKNRKKRIDYQSIHRSKNKKINNVCFVLGFFFNHIHSFFSGLIGECFAFGFQSVCVVTVLNLSESEWFFDLVFRSFVWLI